MTKQRSIQFLLFLALFAATLGLYTVALFPGIGGGLDSAEFQISAKVLGITHPTGYPIYHGFTHALSSLPWFTLAQRVSFFSALCMALSCALLFGLVKKHSSSAFFSLLAVLAFALSPAAWINGTVAEVYAMQTLITVIVLRLYSHYTESHSPRTMYALLFCLGVGMAHHLMTVFLILGIFLCWLCFASVRTPKRFWYWLAGVMFLLPLFSFLYFPLRVGAQAHSFDLYSFESVGDYLTYLCGGTNTNLLHIHPLSSPDSPLTLGILSLLVLFGIAPTLFATFGLSQAIKNKKSESLLYLFLLIIHIYLAGIWTEADREAVLLPALVCMTILLAMGCSAIHRSITDWSKSVWLSYAIIVAILGGSLSLQAVNMVHSIHGRNQHYNHALLENVYESLPPQSVVLSSYWETVNIYKYLAWSGEYEDKDLYVYRWNDPRAQAGMDAIANFLHGAAPLGTDQLSPDTPRRLFFLEPVEEADIPDSIAINPFSIKEHFSIFEITLCHDENMDAPKPADQADPSDFTFTVLEWSWSEPVLNQTISGNPLIIAGETFQYGYGIHGGTLLQIPVPPHARKLRMLIGISGDLPLDSVASVVFTARSSTGLFQQSPILFRDQPATPYVFEIDCEGEAEFFLEVSGTEDGLSSDHAILANPRFEF
jgi:hypothetical protein